MGVHADNILDIDWISSLGNQHCLTENIK